MVKEDEPDSQLVARARSGDMRAFRVLVERHESVVAGTVIGLLGRTPEADDVGQQVFLRFFRALGDFRGESSLKTYLTRIAINLSLNELKRRKRASSRLVRLDAAEATVDDAPLASDDYERREKSRIVRAAVEQLDEPFRLVVVMRMLNGYSTRETADILGVPEGTVLSRLSRAQKKLNELLAPHVKSTL